MTTVYFATNRLDDGSGAFGYGANIAPLDNKTITFAVTDVTNIKLPDESSGIIGTINDKTPGNFSAAATRAIIEAKKNLLVFVHGFDNSFEDAIKRAAFNREWAADSGVVAADMTVLAFTWPSAGKLFDGPPHMPADAYFTDQAQAGRSGWHLAYFLEVIAQLRASYLAANPNGRIILLAHSMGNYALQAAVQTWSALPGRGGTLFDEAILAAADEVDDTFERPAQGRLSGLPNLAKRISVYHSRRDVAMYLSTTLNLTERLGFDGPDDKRNAAKYKQGVFRIRDCTEVEDYDRDNPPDATHQYYRRSKIVRADLASVIAGTPSTDILGSLSGT